MFMQSCPAVRERVSGLKPKTKARLLLDELVENANQPESFVLREDSPLGDEIARWELVSRASGARSAQRIPPIAAQLVGDQARPKVSGLLDVARRLFGRACLALRRLSCPPMKPLQTGHFSMFQGSRGAFVGASPGRSVHGTYPPGVQRRVSTEIDSPGCPASFEIPSRRPRRRPAPPRIRENVPRRRRSSAGSIPGRSAARAEP